MQQIKADKSIFDNLLGLSCIENYLLYVLKTRNINFWYLYAKSYLSLGEIYTAFFNEGIKYAFFYKIDRLQDVASKAGLISLETSVDLIEGIAGHEYCCIEVKPEYVQEQYGKNLWRNDHYVLLCEQHKDGYIYINDNPRDIKKIGYNEILSVYAGQSLCFNIINESINDETKHILLKTLKASLFCEQSYKSISFDSLNVARDVLGILRITRRRISEFCSGYFITDFMDEYLSDLDKLYSNIEYMRLRRTADFNKLNLQFAQIQKSDLDVNDILSRKLEDLS